MYYEEKGCQTHQLTNTNTMWPTGSTLHLFCRNKAEVERLIQLVTEDYGLESLSIDSSISYDKAIVCCENLLASSDSVRYMLSGVRVCIAPYFAVMSDGEMYIMWDWVSDG